MNMPSIASFYKKAGIIALAAVVLRLIISWQISKITSFVQMPPSTTDLATYMNLSRSIINGTFEGAFYYQPFYYAAFLPAVLLIFGQNVWAVITVQAILGGLTVFFAAWCAKIIFNEKSGIITALLLTLSNVLIFYTPFHKIATLQTFIVTMFTFFLALAFNDEKVRLRYWICAGAFLGMGCAARGNLYIMLTGLIPLLLWKFPLKKSIIRIAVIIGMTILMQLPFIIYNSIQEKRLCGSSTASSAVLALGNTPEAPPCGLEYPESYHVFMQNEKKRSVPRQIIDYLLSEPLAYLELTFRKVIFFYDSKDIPNNVNITLQGGSFLNNNITGWGGWILLLGIGGIFFNLKKMFKERDFGMLIVTSNIIFYGLSISMFYNLARFRAPILPAMAIIGGIFTVQCYEKFKAKDYKFPALTLCAGIIIAVLFAPAYRSYEKYIMRGIRPHGTHITAVNGQKAVADNGPVNFGGHEFYPVKENDIIEKSFSGLPADAQGLLQISPFMFKRILLEINGRRMYWDNKKGASIRVPCRLVNGKISIRILKFEADSPGFIFDSQRNYKRSALNGEILDGEWAMKFYY